MQLTNLIIENHGFKRINNSMYRLGYIVLQTTYFAEGKTLIDKILGMTKGYKVWYQSKYVSTINKEYELIRIIKLNES